MRLTKQLKQLLFRKAASEPLTAKEMEAWKRLKLTKELKQLLFKKDEKEPLSRDDRDCWREYLYFETMDFRSPQGEWNLNDFRDSYKTNRKPQYEVQELIDKLLARIDEKKE